MKTFQHAKPPEISWRCGQCQWALYISHGTMRCQNKYCPQHAKVFAYDVTALQPTEPEPERA